MPEMIEVEMYRRLAEQVVGRTVRRVDAPDAWFLKRGLEAPELTATLLGRTVVAARRRGKLLLLDTDGATLGLRFGMTGRLLVDGGMVVEKLVYGSTREETAWDRFALGFDGGGELRLRDPRRLGGVELDPDEDRLGIDAASLTRAELAALLGSAAPLKARLMDQARLAGLGNLLTDEALGRAGLDPARPASSLEPAEVRRLHRHIAATLE
ncbi:MAG: formamidopyrimidine-DNA glycosylase, partial [Acidimicrobiia bacterium]|nr:formamidopyrimidine-DNA glycosylase [Acidimicrobiia bacterium]